MPTSVSSLSASATAHADAGRRRFVAGEARLVMLRARERDFFRLAVVARVVRAHRALQFGEFADHVGQQVGLREQRGALRQRDVDADHRRDLARERFDALARAATASRACCDRRRSRAAARDRRARFFLSCSKKNFASARRGRTTRSLPSTISPGVFVSMFDTIRKRERSLPFASVSAKYFWLVCIVRIRHSCGTCRNSSLEVALIHDRPFDQRVHFVEQRFGHHHAIVAGERLQLRADRFLAVVEARDDMRLRAQRVGVVVGVRRSARSHAT